MEVDMPVLLRRQRVMEMLGVSKEAVYALVDKGRLKKQYILHDEQGNGVGHPYYAAASVVKLKSELEQEACHVG